jgi:hypothetical protein
MSAGVELQLPPMPWLKTSQMTSTRSQLNSRQESKQIDSKRTRSTALEGDDYGSDGMFAGTSDRTAVDAGAGEANAQNDAWHQTIVKDLSESVGVWGLWLLVIVIVVLAWFAWRKWCSQPGDNRSVAIPTLPLCDVGVHIKGALGCTDLANACICLVCMTKLQQTRICGAAEP